MTQRDTFISTLFEHAKKDKDIILISVDMGAPSLDIWREELPDQFIAAGISEQNAINVAAGLSSEGKKVYVYFMASWVARCFEQFRYSCAMAKNPITILGNGVALGYAPAGPAHEPNEDIGYMRTLCDIEIISPANNNMTKSLVELTLKEPKLRYLRLERKYASEMEDEYNIVSDTLINSSIQLIKPGLSEANNDKPKIALLSSGFMLGRALQAWEKLIKESYEISVFDLFKIKKINKKHFEFLLKEYDTIVTLEEQTLDGCFGSAVCETVCDLNLHKKILRIGLPEKYIFENGSRDHLLDTNGLSVDNIVDKIKEF
jgi:transketolase